MKKIVSQFYLEFIIFQNLTKTLKTIVESLRRAKVFSELANNRCYFSFPKPRDVLHSKDHTQLVQWIKEHLK